MEPPASLVNNILASTTGVDTQRLRDTARSAQPRISWWEHVQASLLEPIWATVRQPRFAMSFGMAFFALSVGLTVAGVKPADLRQISLRPSAIRHTYYATQARVVHYYENVRIVYEVESRVREIKRNVAPAEPGPTQSRPAEQKGQERHNTTARAEAGAQLQPDGQPSDSGQRSSGSIVRSLRDLPVVSVTTYRRFV